MVRSRSKSRERGSSSRTSVIIIIITPQPIIPNRRTGFGSFFIFFPSSLRVRPGGAGCLLLCCAVLCCWLHQKSAISELGREWRESDDHSLPATFGYPLEAGMKSAWGSESNGVDVVFSCLSVWVGVGTTRRDGWSARGCRGIKVGGFVSIVDRFDG